MFGSFEWIQMGKAASFLFASSTQNLSLLSSGKATVEPELSKTINKLLFSGTGAVSCFGLTGLY